MDKIYDAISGEIAFSSVNVRTIAIRGGIALVIIILGILLGKIISLGLKKISQKLELNKYVRGSFIDLFLVVIKWSIYIIFINIGLNQLGIPTLTNFFTNILIVIPAFIGALALLAIGFAIAVYLRGVIEDSEITGWDLLSKMIFYFVLYIFGIYSIKLALISFDETMTNYLILILTAVITAVVGYLFVKKEIKRIHS